GALVGRGMAFFVPDLDPKRVMLFGALGGSAGAAGYYFAGALLSDAAGRFLGAALLGLFLGLAVALVELAFRHAWLEVRFGEKEVIRVSLGQRPVRIGGDARHCTVYAAGARAITAEYRLQNGEVQCTDFATERTRPVRAGDQQKIGKLTVTVCTGNAPSVPLGAAAARMPPPPPATRRPDPAPSGAGPPALGVGRPAAAERAGDSLPNQGSGVRLPAEPARSVSSSAKTPPPPPPPKRK
ncbi:MAG TPA: hypothetical protein PLF81_30605, partial [Candidatus Anammoximicrobium sp.]|nr:hypothetical protein [Candidatus Anammoximicrobium sp.]